MPAIAAMIADTMDGLLIEQCADANSAYVDEILRRFADGTLAEGVPVVGNPFTVRTGQSMGGGVTVLIACEERDVAPDIRHEPTAFINSPDISVFEVPRMANMHNFASTRQKLWQRMVDWMQMQTNALA